MKRITSIFAGAFLLVSGAALNAQDATIRIHDAGTGQTIPAAIYGQFSEHLGRCIYGGLWVGKDSQVPNVDGYRKDVFDSLGLQAPKTWDDYAAAAKSLLEAAAMDGAGPFRRFWTVVFPLLSPTTFFLLVMNVIYAFFDTFAIVDATTMGGPGQETNILVYKVFVDGFRNMDYGGSAAQSVVLMALVIVLTVIQFRFIERRVNY